jgi:hypothetical protein
MTPDPDSGAQALAADRRDLRIDRRQRTLRALLVGSVHQRRKAPRRHEDFRSFGAVDWHHPQWLGLCVLILLLSLSDAFLTLVLMQYGATEANPFMRVLIQGSGRTFALWKIALTAVGVVVLTLMVRIRAFGMFPAGALLYLIAAGYVGLIAYELWLLDHLQAIR